MEQHSPSIRAQAVALMRQGIPNRTVVERLNIPRGTVGWWRSEDRRARGEKYEQPTRRVMPLPNVGQRYRTGCVEVKSYTKHWTCLFPQHGPGKKHERRIVLEPWQQVIVDTHSWDFIRGLVHSDGCRITNWTTRMVGGTRKRYEYPRYFFTNVSDDIRQLYTDTLDKLGIEWTHCTRNGNPYNISVARKASVALMDAHVGPKH